MEGETNDAYVTSFDDVEINDDREREGQTGSETEKMEEEDMDAFEFNLITDYQNVEKEDKNLIFYLVMPFLKLAIFISNHARFFKIGIVLTLIAGFIIYTGFALSINFGEALIPLVLGCLAVFFICWDKFMLKYEDKIGDWYTTSTKNSPTFWRLLKIISGLAVCGVLLGLLVYDIFFAEEKIKEKNLVACAGILVYSLLCILMSRAPHKINFRTVIWAFGIQIVFGIFVLRTTAGFIAFDWLSSQIQKFLDYSKCGSLAVFGNSEGDISSFAFSALPTVIYFSMVIAVLYYTGIMPYFIKKISWIMEITCDVSGPEAIVCVGNIFVGQTESPLLIKPFIKNLTQSELFVVMVSGLASIAGSVFGLFVNMGIDSTALLTACVMSAPGSLAIAKMVYPELQKSKFRGKNSKSDEKQEQTANNALEAASAGIIDSIPLVAAIAAMLIGFQSLTFWLNDAIHWMGESVGYDNWSFDILLSYIFYPFTILLGLEMSEVFSVALMVGQKTFFTEIVAYTTLQENIENREKFLPKCDCEGNVMWLSERSEILTTYALSGFANFASIGIVIGGLSGMAPQRRGMLSKLGMLALLTATISCMERACVASILYAEGENPFLWGSQNLRGCEFVDNELGSGCGVSCNGVLINSTESCEVYGPAGGQRSCFD
ncbi:Oidioi.mRNA.OKI2018_I69.chr1.g237.t2.cds [Oikopleura dioica]|uniref:Oidioi.mRNA.OKI2018_I69.chr1.g237.t2.cds n=1 Tax=Oikopleura dioica TaxID=34765 RepID=A0ABN7SKX6_OIKDI|nr:Oidioi.mRNA.OKI2018_I69.chr1.g237.t2.cds [Oikopleura dioica]